MAVDSNGCVYTWRFGGCGSGPPTFQEARLKASSTHSPNSSPCLLPSVYPISSCPPITPHACTASSTFGDGNLTLENLLSSTLVILVTLYSYPKASSHLSLMQANPMLSLLELPNWMEVFWSFLLLMVPCHRQRNTLTDS